MTPVAHCLIDKMPRPYDEKARWGTCTAQALASCYAHLRHKESGEWVRLPRFHLFYQGRLMQAEAIGEDESTLRQKPSCWPGYASSLAATGA